MIRILKHLTITILLSTSIALITAILGLKYMQTGQLEKDLLFSLTLTALAYMISTWAIMVFYASIKKIRGSIGLSLLGMLLAFLVLNLLALTGANSNKLLLFLLIWTIFPLFIFQGYYFRKKYPRQQG